MKPNWQYAPTWANYLAMDHTGEWWWYELEPRMSDYGLWSAYGGQMEPCRMPGVDAARASLEPRL